MSTYYSLGEAWVRELETARRVGQETSPRGMTTLERRWVQFEIEDPLTFPIVARDRDFADAIGVLEALSLLGQFSVPELFTDRVRKFAEFTDGGVFHGGYGARAHGLMQDIVRVLEKDADSRQAVLTLFDSTRDLDRAKRDIPCTLSVQYLVRDGELEQRVTMRSNDLWLGTPYDLTQFAIVQASLAQVLGLQVGAYVHAAGSLHLYERDLEKARGVYEWVDKDEMDFPLWACAPSEVFTRARELAFDRIVPATQFELWAQGVLAR